MRKELMRGAIRKEAKRQAIANGITFESSWDELSSSEAQLLYELAKQTCYRCKYNPMSCLCEKHQLSRNFFYHLKNKVEL